MMFIKSGECIPLSLNDSVLCLYLHFLFLSFKDVRCQ